MRVLAVAADAGSARALVPVARELQSRGILVSYAAAGPALVITSTETFDGTIVDASGADAHDVQEIVSCNGADVVLAGAGCYNMLEHDARVAARRLSVPCVAVLDYWFEYPARFHRWTADGQVASWPDVVCAPDPTAAAELVDAGCRRDAVVVTGPPNIEDALRWWSHHATADPDVLKRRYGVPVDRPVVVFFSEPYLAKPDGRPLTGPGGLYRSDGRPLFGYTAVGMLDQTLDALERAADGSTPPHVIVKAHPLEWAAPLHDRAHARRGSRVGISVLEDADPKELVAIADAVLGMSSVTLMEAALVGRPTFSVQLGDGTAPFDPCVANRLRLVNQVQTMEDLSRAAAAIVRRRAVNPTPATDAIAISGAAARVADVVSHMTTASRSC